MTDVSLKRKVRNFVTMVKDQDVREPQPGEKRFEMHVREKAILNNQNQRAYTALKLDASEEQVVELEQNAEDAESKKRSPRKKSARVALMTLTKHGAGCAKTSLTFAPLEPLCPPVSTAAKSAARCNSRSHDPLNR